MPTSLLGTLKILVSIANAKLIVGYDTKNLAILLLVHPFYTLLLGNDKSLHVI